MRGMPALRHASSSTCTPSTLEFMNSLAPAMERSTCDSAAKLITASWPGRTSASFAGSDVALHEGVPVAAGDRAEVREVARVGELVVDRDVGAGVARVTAGQQCADVVRADE